MLFVIVMKYLHRGLSNLAYVQKFKFHPRCKRLFITKIIFADDNILFPRGDIPFVSSLMQIFNLFSQATGLYVQPTKCHVYFGGVQQRVKQDILQLTGFGKDACLSSVLVCPWLAGNCPISTGNR